MLVGGFDNEGDFEATAWDEYVAIETWASLVGTTNTVDVTRCSKDDGRITCPYDWTSPLVRATFLRISGILRLEIDDGHATLVAERRGNQQLLEAVSDFGMWMHANHPEDAPAMISSAGIIVYTEEGAARWNEYVPLYLAQL